MTTRTTDSATRRLSKIAVLGALGGILMLLEFPLPFAPSFLGVDFSDTPVMLVSMIMGPLAGMATAGVKIVIKLLLKPTSTMLIGEASNLFLSLIIALTVGLIYKKKPTTKGAIIAVSATVVTMSFAALISNAYVVFPAFANILKFPIDSIIEGARKVNFLVKDYWSLMFYAIVPFNIVKQSFVAILTIALVKRIEPILKN